MGRALLLAALLALLAAWPASAVVGGRPATEPYPFTAALYEGGDHICGASLLSPDRALTAAHCVEDAKAPLSVVIGRPDLRTSAGEKIGVSSFKIHPSYTSDEAGGHDVAVLSLKRASSSAPIRLATDAERGLWAPGAPARVLGWGSSIFLVGPGSDQLHEVDVPMVSDADCARYGLVPGFEFDPRTMVCAGEDTGGKDACQGDSGGPLVVRGDTGWIQVGAVSFGLGCGYPLFYGVYARVADEPLRSWINTQVGATSAPGGGSGGGDGPGGGTPDPGRSSVELRPARRKLGSARKARRRGHLKVKVKTSDPVTSVRAILKRKGKVVARGRRASLEDRGRVRVGARKLRKGRHKLILKAVDAAGQKVRHRSKVRVRR